MRVVAGVARGKNLQAPPGEDTTRPTLVRVKEGMFSAIQFLVEGARVLDLFSGSGQLGIEALSRGAKSCVFIDEDEQAHAIIVQNLKETGLFSKARVARQEVFGYVNACHEKFDIVLMDPPFHNGTVEKLLPKLAEMVTENGVVLAETESEAQLPEQVGCLHLAKKYKYGTVCAWRYVAVAEEE